MSTKTSPQNGRPIPGRPIQAFGEIEPAAIALAHDLRARSIESLNQLFADTIALHDRYKKHHWQASGPAFYQLHLLFDKHAAEQSDLANAIAECVQILGGVTIGATHDVAGATLVPRPPRDREAPQDQMGRLLHGHEIVLEEARPMARAAAISGDDGTNDLVVSQVIRTNELQAWFVAAHLRQEAPNQPTVAT
jgi:starvation-inducible DNA-binding protein